VGLAVHGEAAKRKKKLIFYANKSVDGLQLGEYLADFWKMGYHFDCHIMPHSKHALLYFWGSFFRSLRCSMVRQLKVAIVTLRSDQQGDTALKSKLQFAKKSLKKWE
jgi:hypothetical protein